LENIDIDIDIDIVFSFRRNGEKTENFSIKKLDSVRCVLLNMLNRESLRPLSSLSPHN
jgi:hypothetical protein